MAKESIHALLIQAIGTGIPCDQQDRWIKTLYKAENKNQLTNYQTITKLLQSTLEHELRKQAGEHSKRVWDKQVSDQNLHQ